ncbi:zinc finger, CCHC-type containing protein [Tanacetum coccineum]
MGIFYNNADANLLGPDNKTMIGEGEYADPHAMTTSVGNNSVFRSFFDKQKLTGPNFIDWYRQLHLVLSTLTMDLDIQQNLAHLGAYDMLQELKAMFSKQAKQELLQTVREFHTCKQEEGQSVSSHDFTSLVQNFNIHGMGKTVNELHVMLKLHEETLPKKHANPALHAIRAGKTPPPPKKDNPAKDAICHQCGEIGHWRRNCPGLQGSKKLKPGALSLYVGDGHRVAVEAIGTYHLELPSGLVIVLNNCHYAPSITRGVISVSKNNLVYFMAVPRDEPKLIWTLLSCGTVVMDTLARNALKICNMMDLSILLTLSH